jgi:pyruvate-ferredoxin/flavodoxin oxidoreductase
MKLLDAKGKGVEGYKFRIQISTLDCTGCSVCANVCPSKEKSLIMKPLESQVGEDKNWDYLANSVTVKKVDMSVTTVKGSQFKKPYFEFSGACAGCGETPYVRTVTQLFGERMMIANATGCSSIYGGSAPATPYCKDSEGRGPAWGNSLFEDNAEYGMGMALGVDKLRSRIELKMRESLNTVSSELKGAFNSWLEAKEDGDKSVYATNALLPILEKDKSAVAKEILDLKQYLIKKSVWIIGGDGWAYDIGYGGLDHVLASGENVNVLVLDTEVYSNTGGQSSKSSARGSVAKFTTSGKTIGKKDLGRMAMTYGYVYVAQVAIGANQAQFLKVLAEAEAYQGPSLIIAYAPCIAHGIKGGMENMISQEKLAVESGYWHLYRYNPLLEKEGKNPFVLESKGPKFDQLKDFMMSEVRYNTLTKSFPDEATRLFESAVSDAKWRYASYKRMNDHY